MFAMDKRLHFLVGAAITLPFAVLDLWWVGLALAFAAGAAKEVYDYAHPTNHTANFFDFAATAVGGVFGALLGWLVQ